MNAPPSSDAEGDAWAACTTIALRAGSRAALAEVYDRFADSIVTEVLRTTRRDEAFALDCLQETFLKLAAHPPLCDSHRALDAWLRTVALNTARSAIVADSRRDRRERAARTDADPTARGTTPLHEVHDTLDRIDAAIDADARALLELRFARGLSIAAIARALDRAPRMIESAIRRALARARAHDHTHTLSHDPSHDQTLDPTRVGTQRGSQEPRQGGTP